MEQTLILIQCRDEVGLVSSVSQVVARHGMNIITMREFVDETQSLFFARFVCTGLKHEADLIKNRLEEVLPKEALVKVHPPSTKKLAIMVTKEPHCLGDILVRHFFHTLGADVVCVLGNYEVLRSFTEKFGIPFHFVDHVGKNKEDFEKEIHRILLTYEPDYVVLAKFMRVLSPVFIKHYPGRIINIHHSFLPAFVGANPYKQAFVRGVKLIGATAHFVTDDLDEGPIIAQDIRPVNHTYKAEDMRRAGKEIEKSVLIKAISLILEDRVFMTGNKTVVFE
ncbi:formyltetrahydrofolate deformylase [Olivibacter sitiensis]|uniref:formyltetrahydrofolate deformylase n=1 Tax=Olivibacter sitiensis TaxID=376470 RepID=UPI0004870705|nr:formyltetrahydrofolate deformylase [Olivibacter sitiensis]